MYHIAVRWTEYAPRVVHLYPELFAEMFGFIFATVELKLPFTLVKSIVVSVTTTAYVKYFHGLDAIPRGISRLFPLGCTATEKVGNLSTI